MSTMAKRFSWRLNRIKELHLFNQKHQVPGTFFFGMRTGLNLSYHWKAARKYVRFLKGANIDVGLHGMAFNDLTKMREEKKRLEELLDAPVDGIRNHYLRLDATTLTKMNQLEFKFDSTHTGLEFPSKQGRLTEFPISLMDVQLLKYHSGNLDIWMAESRTRIDDAAALGLPYFVLNFHDVYYSSGWPVYQAWYENIVVELKQRQFEFISFRTAMDELAR